MAEFDVTITGQDWGTKYTCEWTDILNHDWRADLEYPSYTGSITNMFPTGNPLNIEFLSGSTIFGSRADLEIESREEFQWTFFAAIQDREYRMTIFCDNVIKWQGYISTEGYSEPYDAEVYPVILSASDGLGDLKTIIYAESVDVTAGVETITYFTGRRLESQVIIDILSKIGISEFKEYINVYEANMDSTVLDSPFDQTLIDVDLFKDMTCYEVLTHILSKYDASIRQFKGQMLIYRQKELAKPYLYGRYFILPTTKSDVLTSLNQYFARTGLESGLTDVKGGNLNFRRPAKKITINQDYGDKKSWIDNYDVKPSSYVGSQYQSWTPMAGWGRQTIAGVEKGITIGQTGGSMPATNGVYQSFGTYIITTSDILVFSFEYLTRNVTGSTITSKIAYIKIKSDSANKWLTKNGDALYQWSNSLAYIEVGAMDIPDGVSGWTTVTRNIPGIPTAGTYTISLYGIDTATACTITYNNLQFYSTSDAIVAKKQPLARFKWWDFFTGFALGGTNRLKAKVDQIQHGRTYSEIDNKEEMVRNKFVLLNTISGTAISGNELEFNYLIGDVADADMDNIIEQFQGALIVINRAVTSGQVDTVTLSGTAGACYITCNGIQRMAIFNSTLTQTATDFVTAYLYDYDPVVLSSSGADVIFTASGYEELVTTVVDLGLDGAVVTTPAVITETLVPSTTWSTFNGASDNEEDKPLLQLVGDELKTQYSRPVQTLLRLPVIESDINSGVYGLTDLSIFGNFQDPINVLSGVGGNLITGWVNDSFYPYDTLLTNKVKVTSAISAGYAKALSLNSFPVVSGETFRIICYIDASTSAPNLMITNGSSISSVAFGNPGFNDVEVTATFTGNAYGAFQSTGCGFSIRYICICRTTRKFAFNSGTLNAKDREWNLDLIEII